MLEDYLHLLREILEGMSRCESIAEKGILLQKIDHLYFLVVRTVEDFRTRCMGETETQNYIDLRTVIALIKERLTNELRSSGQLQDRCRY